MGLYFAEYGTENDETIVFVHGAALSGWMWRNQIAGLQDEFHCLVPDLPAHGKSEDVQPFSMKNSVGHLAQLIQDKAHGGRAHLVGLSLGATVCIDLLRTHPDLVKRVAISAPPSGPFPGTSILIFIARFMMPLFKSDFVINQSAKQLKMTGEDLELFRRDQKAMTSETMRQISVEIHEHRLSAILQNSEVPVLAMLGEHDNKINYRVVRDLVQIMPSAQAWVAPDVGHGWNGENPPLFNAAVRDWFVSGTVAEGLESLS